MTYMTYIDDKSITHMGILKDAHLRCTIPIYMEGYILYYHVMGLMGINPLFSLLSCKNISSISSIIYPLLSK